MGEGNVFTRVCPSIILSVHTPTRTGYTAVGMRLAFTQEDYLREIKWTNELGLSPVSNESAS